MIKLFGEQPLLLSVLLVILAGAFLYIWTRSGRQALGIIGGVLLALVPLVWLVAARIETDAEQIRAMILEVAEDVEANRVEQALEAIHPDRDDIRRRAEAELPRYEFSRVKVGSFRVIRVLPGTNPPEAVVDLLAGVTASMSNGMFRDQRGVRRIMLHLQKTPRGWKVIDYAHRPPVGPADAFSTGSPRLDSLLGE